MKTYDVQIIVPQNMHSICLKISRTYRKCNLYLGDAGTGDDSSCTASIILCFLLRQLFIWPFPTKKPFCKLGYSDLSNKMKITSHLRAISRRIGEAPYFISGMEKNELGTSEKMYGTLLLKSKWAAFWVLLFQLKWSKTCYC